MIHYSTGALNQIRAWKTRILESNFTLSKENEDREFGFRHRQNRQKLNFYSNTLSIAEKAVISNVTISPKCWEAFHAEKSYTLRNRCGTFNKHERWEWAEKTRQTVTAWWRFDKKKVWNDKCEFVERSDKKKLENKLNDSGKSLSSEGTDKERNI